MQKIDTTRLLLNAYYEALHRKLVDNRDSVFRKISLLLTSEVRKNRLPITAGEKFEAYLQACYAFVDERIESYNPIGIQYTYPQKNHSYAAELEFQLAWYGGKPEFHSLLEAIREKTADRENIDDKTLAELAERLVIENGAYPDHSIISAYLDEPNLLKLPDYIVARAIEQTVR
mgnify:CR=1 FL=1|jgi:hypothetical protein